MRRTCNPCDGEGGWGGGGAENAGQELSGPSRKGGKFMTGIKRTMFYMDHKVTVCSHGQCKLFWTM